MMGMVWAGLVLVGVPLSIGIGVLVLVLRRRDQAGAPSSDSIR